MNLKQELMLKQVEAKKIWCLGLDLCFRFGLVLVKGKDTDKLSPAQSKLREAQFR